MTKTESKIRDEKTFRELLAITNGCRQDMHEPDEQGLEARVVGTRLDNAMGNSIDPAAVLHGHQEIIIVLDRDGWTLRLNLADLIAYARCHAAAELARAGS